MMNGHRQQSTSMLHNSFTVNRNSFTSGQRQYYQQGNYQTISHFTQQQRFEQQSYSDSDLSGYSSDGSSSVRSDDSSVSSVTIVPKERNEADGYNQYSKIPSGNLRQTASGQAIELFEGTHEGARRDALGYPIFS